MTSRSARRLASRRQTLLTLVAVGVLSACGDTSRHLAPGVSGAPGGPYEGKGAAAGVGGGSSSAGVAGAVSGAGTGAGEPNPAGGGGASPGPGGGAAGSMAGMDALGGASDEGAVGLVACPASMPEGACSIDRLSCTYPTGSCWCDQGSWTCIACPVTQPTTDDDIPCDVEVSMACRYGAVTCSCAALGSRGRGCGICPAARPTAGELCGNTAFECQYDGDTCACGADGRWQCATATCPLPPGPFSSVNCVTPGHFTCRYPREQQYCSCDPFNYNSPVCTCPAILPAEGSACLVPGRWFDMGSPSCTYGASSCTCIDAAWHCLQACPQAPPSTGTTCAAPLSCSYPAAICGCDGTKWTCQ